MSRMFFQTILLVVASFVQPLQVSMFAAHGKPLQHPARVRSHIDPFKSAVLALAMNTVSPSQNLAKACARSDFKLLAVGLSGIRSRINQPKREFETIAEYDERTAKVEAILNGSERIIVCQPLDDNDDAPFSYDADHEIFKGSFNAEQNVWRDVKRLGSYVSHTRMGIKAKVRSSLELEYNVVMGDSLKQLGTACGVESYPGYSYEVRVPRSEARRVKSDGYLVFLGRLVAPFISTSEIPGSPTLDDPDDTFESDLIVYFNPSEVAVVAPDGKRFWECQLALATTAASSSGIKPVSDVAGTPVGKIWLQLASNVDADALPAQFQRIKSRTRTLFEGIRAYVARTGDRARLLVGPFRTAEDADTFAQDLHSIDVSAFRWTNSEADTISPLAA